MTIGLIISGIVTTIAGMSVRVLSYLRDLREQKVRLRTIECETAVRLAEIEVRRVVAAALCERIVLGDHSDDVPGLEVLVGRVLHPTPVSAPDKAATGSRGKPRKAVSAGSHRPRGGPSPS